MSKKKVAHLEYDRDTDGVDYIAISSKARTRLGRALAAGAHLPFEHRDYGRFNCIAGLIRYLTGDHRDIVHDYSGVEYDDAYTDGLGTQYDEVLHHYLMGAVRTLSYLDGDVRNVKVNKLKFHLFHCVDGEWIHLEMPQWLQEVTEDLLKGHVVATETETAVAKSVLGAKILPWDHTEFTTPSNQRSLMELQAAYLEAHHGTDEMIDFIVSQAEYDSIPENVRTMMGMSLKIQGAFEGTAVPAPPKKIM